ncbi:MAG: sulfite exporter TauE/SafE family protein [Proteobacteria bacterium]|nr:sulfite exporter TauE/SafE family protein [Burkholderiales bacterium]
MKGAFGGGLAALGIPLISLVMDPISAGALLAPLFIVMDVVAFRYWKPSTWSRPDLYALVPPMVLGIGAGYWLISRMSPHWVSISIAVVTLGFAALWFVGGSRVVVRPRSTWKAIAAGSASGVTTMVAHSGSPPVAIYLLSLGLPKSIYAGTTSMYFTVANAVKAGPWLLLGRPDASLWLLMLACTTVVPLGVWVGWRMHQRLDERQLYSLCYVLLALTSLKLLWDGIKGLAT